MLDRRPPPSSARTAELSADPEAARWAQECGWLPGTGHCRSRACGTGCLFRSQCDGEAERITRLRRIRRSTKRAFAARLGRLALLLR